MTDYIAAAKEEPTIDPDGNERLFVSDIGWYPAETIRERANAQRLFEETGNCPHPSGSTINANRHGVLRECVVCEQRYFQR